jgi:hypothetical protein
VVDQDRMDVVLSKEEPFAAISSMNNGKSPNIDGLPCEFCKPMRDTMGLKTSIAWPMRHFIKVI